MKVGTDGVLLGAWARVEPQDERILDIGTGTGLIALMLAQRSAARITAVEIDPGSASQARENADASPWGERIEVVCSSVQAFDPGRRFGLIVSNPPFYVDSLTCPDRGRSRAAMRRRFLLRNCATRCCGCSRPTDVSALSCRRRRPPASSAWQRDGSS